MYSDTEIPDDVKCPKCGRVMPQRLYRLEIGTSIHSHEWRYKRPVCPVCEGVPCMVAGCEQPAKLVIRRTISVGTGSTSLAAPWQGADISDIRHDLWFCQPHGALVEQYRSSAKKKSRPAYFLSYLFLAAAAVLAYLIIKDVIGCFSAPAIIAGIIILLGLGATVNVIIPGQRESAEMEFKEEQHLTKKEEFALLGKYRDDGFLDNDTLIENITSE